MINVKEVQALVDQAQKSAEVAYVKRVIDSLKKTVDIGLYSTEISINQTEYSTKRVRKLLEDKGFTVVPLRMGGIHLLKYVDATTGIAHEMRIKAHKASIDNIEKQIVSCAKRGAVGFTWEIKGIYSWESANIVVEELRENGFAVVIKPYSIEIEW